MESGQLMVGRRWRRRSLEVLLLVRLTFLAAVQKLLRGSACLFGRFPLPVPPFLLVVLFIFVKRPISLFAVSVTRRFSLPLMMVLFARAVGRWVGVALIFRRNIGPIELSIAQLKGRAVPAGCRFRVFKLLPRT